jgi:hypothetical protein
MTLQRAPYPHVPGHGSWHLLRTQALSRAQSELMVHSGRQPEYGLPKYPGRHSHKAFPFGDAMQRVFGPQGDG